MQLPLWSITPFAVMLASIAILPLVGATKHWWEKPSSQLILALVLGVPTAIATGLAVGWEHVGGAVVEYIQFISLILSLFVVAGGIHLRGDIQATPKNNTVFLAIGGTIASLWAPPAPPCCSSAPYWPPTKNVNTVYTRCFTPSSLWLTAVVCSPPWVTRHCS